MARLPQVQEDFQDDGLDRKRYEKEDKMKYPEAMQTIDTEKALTYLGFEPKINGSYLEFICPTCLNKASIRYHGEKKNVSYCQTCKAGSNIIALAVKIKVIEFQDAKNLLIEKATYTDKQIEEPLNLNYTLEWTDEMGKIGLNQELCQKLGVGKPKGKTMLSGSLVFTVYNDQGVKVAYWGLKDGKPKFHSSFNPENYLYNIHNCAPGEVHITKDMIDCLRIIHSGSPCLCNFGLPYISTKQYSLLNNFEKVVIHWTNDKRDVAFSCITQIRTFYRFV